MDFTPDPEQQAVADVVTSVLGRDNSWDALVAGGVTALASRQKALGARSPTSRLKTHRARGAQLTQGGVGWISHRTRNSRRSPMW